MEHIRLPLLSQDYLIHKVCQPDIYKSDPRIWISFNQVDSEPLLKQNDNCKDFIIEAMKYHLLKVERVKIFDVGPFSSLYSQGDMKLAMTLTSPRTKPRQPVGLPKVQQALWSSW